MFTKGKRVAKDKKVEVINPYNDQVFQTLGMSDGRDVEAAIATAHKGFEILKRMPAGERAHVLEKASNIIKQRREDFGRIRAAVAERVKHLAPQFALKRPCRLPSLGRPGLQHLPSHHNSGILSEHEVRGAAAGTSDIARIRT